MSAEHEQVEIFVEDFGIIKVDKGIEDIIQNLFYYGFYTGNSCRDNHGNIWLDFIDFGVTEELYQAALTDHLKNCEEKDFDTFYEFLQNECELRLLFNDECVLDPENEGYVIPTGRIEHSISIRFDKELLPHFRDLFFELFPAST